MPGPGSFRLGAATSRAGQSRGAQITTHAAADVKSPLPRSKRFYPVPGRSQAVGAEVPAPLVANAAGGLDGRSFPGQEQAPRPTGYSARPGEAATLTGRFSEAPGKTQAEPRDQPPVCPTTPSARGHLSNGTGGRSRS